MTDTVENIIDKLITAVIGGLFSAACLLFRFGGKIQELNEMRRDVAGLQVRVDVVEKELSEGRALFRETSTHIKYIKAMIEEIKAGNAATNERLDKILGDAGKRRALTDSEVKKFLLQHPGGTP